MFADSYSISHVCHTSHLSVMQLSVYIHLSLCDVSRKIGNRMSDIWIDKKDRHKQVLASLFIIHVKLVLINKNIYVFKKLQTISVAVFLKH